MLVKKEEAKKIVADCKLIKISKTNACFRKDLVDVKPMNNGFIVIENGTAKHFVNGKNVVSRSVLQGDFSLKDVAMTCLNCREYRFFDISVTPIWKLELDTITGKSNYKLVEDYKAITMSGRILTLCWFGGKTEKELKAKIRRKLKEMQKKGLVEVYEY